MVYEVENYNSSCPTQQTHCREANSCSTGKEMSYVSYKPKIIHRVHQRAPLGPIGPNETSLHPTMLLEGFIEVKDTPCILNMPVRSSVVQCVHMLVTVLVPNLSVE
jgi:hypothetical protein